MPRTPFDYNKRSAARALELAKQHLPIGVTDHKGGFDDRRVVAPTLVARASFTVHALYELEPPVCLDAAQELTRSLFDQVTTFAWVEVSNAQAIRHPHDIGEK